jgi:hypothetical protein
MGTLPEGGWPAGSAARLPVLVKTLTPLKHETATDPLQRASGHPGAIAGHPSRGSEGGG